MLSVDSGLKVVLRLKSLGTTNLGNYWTCETEHGNVLHLVNVKFVPHSVEFFGILYIFLNIFSHQTD